MRNKFLLAFHERTSIDCLDIQILNIDTTAKLLIISGDITAYM